MTTTEYWKKRWQENKIGWHREEVHPVLKKFYFHLNHPQKIFVPLCGKSLDLLWLKDQDTQVVGIETSVQALEDFQQENQLLLKTQQQQNLTLYYTAGLELFQGDFFDLTPSHVHGVQAVYDRAALIALDADQRKRYAQHMLSLFPTPVPQLIVTYHTENQEGPPHTLAAHELQELYGQDYTIELLDEIPSERRPHILTKTYLLQGKE